MTYIGIDVSKATFVVAYSSEKGSKTKTFKNTPEGIKDFIRTISPTESHCVFEATGNYSMLLVYLLSKEGITVSMENPLKIKNFARTMLSVVKTDEVDARLIAMYGERMRPAPFKLPSDSILLLKQKRTVLRQLKKQFTANKNLEESLKGLPLIDTKCKKILEKTIKFLKEQIEEAEQQLTSLAKSEYKKQMDLLTSIKGIGVTLATALIIATGGFSYFGNAKQLTRYLGLSPTYQKSGTSVNTRGHINRNGDAYLRGQLYLGAVTAIRYNTECKVFYERLRSKGKPGKLAVIAVANKLIRQAFAIVTHGEPYVDGYKTQSSCRGNA